MKSIRAFLLWRLLLGSAIVLVLAGFGVFLLFARSLEAQFDANLDDRVQGFASILFQHDVVLSFEFSDELMPEYEYGERPEYFQLWLSDGQIVERSNSLMGEDLTVPDDVAFTPVHWTAPLPDGREGRYVARRLDVHHVYPEEGPDRPVAAQVIVAVAHGREALLAAERAVLVNSLAASVALSLLIAFLSWLAVKRGLEPANRLASALDAIEVEHLPESLAVGALPSELVPVAEKTDALIRRVDTALVRERRTTADIAHELRTPISELLTVSEVAIRHGDDAAGAMHALEVTRDVATRMGQSVSTLLRLTRVEMGAETFDRVGVDLGALVADSLRSLADLEAERELQVANRVNGAGPVQGDREVLGIIISNLLGNALYYTPRHGRVECRLTKEDGTWRFEVDNDAPDLSPDDLRVLAEPFWRKDHARVDRSRSGLGLALSSALAEKSGMTLEFELEAGRLRTVLCG